MTTRRRIALLLICSTLSGLAFAAFVYSDLGPASLYVIDDRTAYIFASFLAGFVLPLLLILPWMIRNKTARVLVCSTLAGLVGVAGFVFWDVGFTFFDIF